MKPQPNFPPRYPHSEIRMMEVISHQLAVQRSALLEPYGITASQARVLMFLIHHQQDRPLTGRDLERTFSLKSSSVTSTLSYLEKGGFIERQAHQSDARSKAIAITPKGYKLRGTLQQIAMTQRAMLLAGFDETEQQLLSACLERMMKNLRAQDDACIHHGPGEGATDNTED